MDTDVVDGESYTYRIIAVDDDGDRSKPSRRAAASYDPAPDAPTALEAEAVGKHVRLSWSANSEPDVDGYKVYRNGQQVATVTRPGYIDHNESDGKRVYTVTAVDQSDQESDSSNAATVDPSPDAPTGLTAADHGDNNVKLNWHRNGEDDVAGYRIYRAGVEIDAVGPNRTTYVDRRAPQGCVSYTIRAFDASEESPPSDVATVCPGPPTAPTDFDWEIDTAGTLFTRWAANTEDDFAYYRVWFDGRYQGRRYEPHFEDLGHFGTYDHRLRVVARDDDGNESSTVFRFEHHERRLLRLKVTVDSDDRDHTPKRARPGKSDRIDGFDMR